MSRFKNEIAHLQAHIKTLRLGAGALFVVALVLGFGWWSAPRDLTIHVPPDLRSGSVRKWWEVPPESVYAFTFYVFQQLNRWPTNGEDDYARNIHALSAYLTPGCQIFLRRDYEQRRSTGELRQRVRGIPSPPVLTKQALEHALDALGVAYAAAHQPGKQLALAIGRKRL